MPSQTDIDGTIIHNPVLNYEPILMDYQPFTDNQQLFLNNLKLEWSEGKPYISIDGITAEDALAVIVAYSNSSEFLNIIRQYIKSNLFPIDAQTSVEKFLKFEREFKVIDKQKLLAVLNTPQNISEILTPEEIQILKDQALFRNLISDINEPLIENDLTEALKYNLYFYEKSSSYYSLYQSGVVDKIKEYINLNPSINEAEVIRLIKLELEKQLNTHLFISYDEIQQVLEDPLNVGNILNKEQFVSVLYRAATSLSFVSQDDINQIELLYDSNNVGDIRNIFNSNEIKLIMENEINEKKIISNMLTFEQVTAFFNDLKTQFFSSDFLGLITITIEDIDRWILEIEG